MFHSSSSAAQQPIAHRIQWLGYLERMDDQRMSEEILRAQVYKRRKRGPDLGEDGWMMC